MNLHSECLYTENNILPKLLIMCLLIIYLLNKQYLVNAINLVINKLFPPLLLILTELYFPKFLAHVTP